MLQVADYSPSQKKMTFITFTIIIIARACDMLGGMVVKVNTSIAH